jgi:hypothetical protein
VAQATPIEAADTVIVGAAEWAQPDLFADLSWTDIDAVCSGGTCNAGTLNGYDMGGWLWATLEDTNRLFNSYIGSDVMGPGPDIHFGVDTSASEAFFDDGWRTNVVFFSPNIIGLVADNADVAPNVTSRPCGFACSDVSRFSTEGALKGLLGNGFPGGGWFYRSSVEIPISSSLLLLLTALGMLRFLNGKTQKGKHQESGRKADGGIIFSTLDRI